MLQVQRERFLVAVERLEEVAVALAEKIGSHRARDIAAARALLDLDDFGAEVGEVRGAERSGAVHLHREDAHSLQGRHQAGFRAISCLAMMMRCISLVPSPMHMSGASR